MCQLLGLSAAEPIQIRFSWKRFALRGSAIAGNPDGWGVAYASGKDVQRLREPAPAADSELVKFLEKSGPPSTAIISHIRRATNGQVDLANTHPFCRALNGQMHVFAHNGHVGELSVPSNPFLQPVGTTDSERMFCVLLHRLLSASECKPSLLSLAQRTAVITEFAEEMRERGAVNFLYFDGKTLFAHGHRKTLPGADLSSEPGLYLLEQPHIGEEHGQPCEGLSTKGVCVSQCLVATSPLDSQNWRPFSAGELVRMERGAVL